MSDLPSGSPVTHQFEVKGSLITMERLSIVAEMAAKCRELDGEFWEMGVYMGGSAGLIGKIGENKTLRLFDSFEGVSEPVGKDMPTVAVLPGNDLPMWAGEWRGDMKRALHTIGRPCEVHKGWIPETFKQVPDSSRVAFAHVDVDLYEPTKASLEFILPRLVTGGRIVVDDFDYPRHPGIRTAIEETVERWPALRGEVRAHFQIVLRMED